MIRKHTDHWGLSLLTPSLGYKGLEEAQCLKNLYRSCLLMECSFANDIDSSISQKVFPHIVTIARICLFLIPSFLSVSVFLSGSLSPPSVSVCMCACPSLPSSVFVASPFFSSPLSVSVSDILVIVVLLFVCFIRQGLTIFWLWTLYQPKLTSTLWHSCLCTVYACIAPHLT